MGIILVAAGALAAGVGGIWFVFCVFRESVLWGVLCLVTGVAIVVPLFLYWDKVKNPFFWLLGGLAMMYVGARMSPEAAMFRGILG